MSPLFKKCPLTEKPAISILNYTAESDVAYAPDRKRIESRHIRIFQYYNENILVMRRKACRRVHQEMERLARITENSATPDFPYQGIKFYFEYHRNELVCWEKTPGINKCYILDGEHASKTEILACLEREAFLLIESGLQINTVEIEDDDGRVFCVCEDGMI